jgi:RalBP1-associated Eps domain-containing protein
MHLVVLRRNNIPIPSSLPTCLQPPFLHKALGLPEVPPEGDLLQLESDDNQSESNVNNKRDDKNDYQRMVSSTYDELPSSKPSSLSTIHKSSTLPKNHYSQHQRVVDGSGDNNSNIEIVNKQPVTSKNVISSTINRSNSNTPPSQVDGGSNLNENQNSNKEWTKFAESPTSNLSSPGPKPVNFTTKIDPSASQVIHPVALRVTPVGMEIADDDAQRTFRGADNLVYESGIIRTITNNENNEKIRKPPTSTSYQRDSLPNDLRAIQRPHPKKPASKNIGTIPLPPIDSNHVTNNVTTSITTTTTTVMTTNKKEVPPLPPPRPHRHTRSSSLDLQRIKLTNNNNNNNNCVNNGTQNKEKDPPSSQPPELPPPRLEKTHKMASVDTGYIDGPREESFADFTHFPEETVSCQFHVSVD